VSRPFPSWNRSILTEIYLCHACSCQEMLRTETAGRRGGEGTGADDLSAVRRLRRFASGEEPPSWARSFDGQALLQQMRVQSLATLAGTSTAGNRLRTGDLQLIAQLFRSHDGGQLDEDAFVSLLGQVSAATATATQLRTLFRKVDASADGFVDCDELLQFLLTRESLMSATQPSSLGGGCAQRGSGGGGGGLEGGMQSVCLRLQRRVGMRSAQRHGPSQPVKVGAAVVSFLAAVVTEICVCDVYLFLSRNIETQRPRSGAGAVLHGGAAVPSACAHAVGGGAGPRRRRRRKSPTPRHVRDL
jgi:hypothetical protein